jgi:hypothetical protein
MHKSWFALLGIIVLIAMTVGSATTQTPSTRPALSGTLNLLCTPQIVWCEGMKAEFQKVYPKVTVEFVRLSSGEALTRLRDERAGHGRSTPTGALARAVAPRGYGRLSVGLLPDALSHRASGGMGA